MSLVEITVENIENFRGGLKVTKGDLPFDLWALFDRSQYDNSPKARIVPLRSVVSRKNELLDPKFVERKIDPRQNALNRMFDAANGRCPKRGPLLVQEVSLMKFDIIDGNATAQVLMLAGWTEVPVIVENG